MSHWARLLARKTGTLSQRGSISTFRTVDMAAGRGLLSGMWAPARAPLLVPGLGATLLAQGGSRLHLRALYNTALCSGNRCEHDAVAVSMMPTHREAGPPSPCTAKLPSSSKLVNFCTHWQ